MEPRAPKTCPRCQASFECGLKEGHEACWCFECPHVMLVVEEADCLCPNCLRAEIAERTSPEEAPHPRGAFNED